ncbi:MAG: transporter substrate-binding domain-containing protein [Verrucomicrobiales bacterium]
MRPKHLALVLAAGILAACGKATHSEKRGDEPLRVGMELTYPPFEMQDDQGRPDGVGVKMAEALAHDLNRPLKIVPMQFDGLIPALKTGSIDLVISSMTATDDRRQSIDFSDPYAFTALAMLVGSNSDIQSVADLSRRGGKVVVKSTTTGESWAERNLPNLARVAFQDEAACVLEVAHGRADAFIYDQLSIYRYHKENPRTTRALLEPIVEESWAIGLRKGDDELKRQINDFLRRFRAEKGFARLGEEFLGEEKQLLESMGIPFILR